MAQLQNVIPMRWTSGPLEIAKRVKSGTLTPENRQTIEKWHTPAALDLVGKSPVDCLVLAWAAGLPEDSEQQKTAAPLVAAARQRGLSVVGWTDGAIDNNAAIASAKAAGLSAIAIQNFKGKSDFPVIAWSDRSEAAYDSPGPLIAVTGNVWPGVAPSANRNDPNAGPTGLPWLDSNSWFIQMARTRLRVPLWLMFDPPGKGEVITAQRYAAVVSDAETPGAHWAISLDDNVRAGLLSGNAAAKDTWDRIGNSVAFYQGHTDWKAYGSLGQVGVISDFTGENFDRSGEILNLMGRRDLLFRAIWKSQAAALPFTGLKTLVYPDAGQPAPELRRKMVAFAQQGGLLVTGPGWGAEGVAVDPGFHSIFDVRTLGKGRLAVAKEEIIDSYQVAVDVQLLHSYRNDLVKFYNSSSSGCTLLTGSAGGRRALLQSLSYADRRGGFGGTNTNTPQKTVWFREKYSKAKAWSIGADAVALQSEPAGEFPGVEFRLPASYSGQAYVAMELEA